MAFKNSTVRRHATQAAVALALAAAAASPALGQLTDAQKSAMKSNCRSDFFANCMSTSPGTREALECLQHNLPKLSPGCHAAVEATMPKPAPAAAAPPPPPPAAPPPAAMAPPPPAAAPPPPAAAAVPAPYHAVKRTKKEKTRMAAPKPAPLAPPPPPVAVAPPQPDPAVVMAKAASVPLPKRLAVFRACNQDQAAVCPTVKRGGGRLIACMAMHADALSPHCRKTIAAVMQ